MQKINQYSKVNYCFIKTTIPILSIIFNVFFLIIHNSIYSTNEQYYQNFITEHINCITDYRATEKDIPPEKRILDLELLWYDALRKNQWDL